MCQGRAAPLAQSPQIPSAFYCSDAYSRLYFVRLAHPSSTYCSSTPAESALASLVSTTVYDASEQKLMKYAGLKNRICSIFVMFHASVAVNVSKILKGHDNVY